MELEQVKVTDIVEYNTELGSRCYLLRELGIDTYSDTTEDIYDALVKSEGNEQCFSICKDNSRCGVFYERFCDGETPYAEEDPICLEEFDGRYWVREGKHRVCMAKRAGIETICARVEHLDKDYYSLLPPVGTAGRKVFRATYGVKAKGEVAILWTEPPRNAPSSIFSFSPVALNSLQFYGKKSMRVFSGLSYSRSVRRNLFGGMSITAEVKISESRPNTRIWLYTLPADGNGEITTIFRCGRWRNYHLPGVYGFQGK